MTQERRAARDPCATRSFPQSAAAQWVYDILDEAKQPLKAYDILATRLRQGVSCHPPTIYRALAELEAEGWIHRVEPLKAYLVCRHLHPQGLQSHVLLICDQCGAVSEAQPPSAETVARLEMRSGYEVDRVVVEGHGLCRSCQQEGVSRGCSESASGAAS